MNWRFRASKTWRMTQYAVAGHAHTYPTWTAAFHLISCLSALFLACTAVAQDQMSALYDRAAAQLEISAPEQSPYFWQRFQQAIRQRTGEVFEDDFNPFSNMSWFLRNPDNSWQDYLDHGNDDAQGCMFKSLEYSARDASLTLPMGTWVDMQQDILGKLFVNSVDAVEEESVSPLNPKYQATERRWWQSLASAQSLRYGVRPLRTDPYAFVGFRIEDGGQPMMLAHVRYYFRDFADHRFQLALSFPISNRVALDVGTAYQFGQHDEQKKVVVKLTKSFKNGGVAHLGMEVQQTPLLIAGISFPL